MKYSKSKFHIMCSCVECRKVLTSANIVSHSDTHIKVIKSHCLHCGLPIYSNNKFCNRSCAASYNNTYRDYTKFTPGPKPGSKPKIKIKPQFTKIKQCTVCGKYHVGLGKSCSPTCKSKLLSIAMKKRMYNGFDPNSNRGRGKQSYLEQSFENWIKKEFPNLLFQMEFKIKRLDKVKTYYADFFFPTLNLIIELDGSQHLETKEYDEERDSYIRTTYGYEIIRIDHRDYINKTKIKEIRKALYKVNQG